MNAKLIAENEHGLQLRYAARTVDTWPGWAAKLGQAGFWLGTSDNHTYLGRRRQPALDGAMSFGCKLVGGQMSSSTRSWIVRYRARPPHHLIGGGTSSESSRYQRREDAEVRYQSVLGLYSMGTVDVEILESPLPPEIIVHCPGSYLQAIGGKCFICKKTLTQADANVASPIE